MEEPTEDARRLRVALGQALRDARVRAGLRNQDQLAERLGTTQQTISRYENGELVDVDDVVALEDVLRLGRGGLLVAAGYVPEDVDVLDLIRRDTSITSERRELIIEIYERGRERAGSAPSAPKYDAGEELARENAERINAGLEAHAPRRRSSESPEAERPAS